MLCNCYTSNANDIFFLSSWTSLVNTFFVMANSMKCIFWFVCFCRLWFDELISLWVSVQNLPSWEVVSIVASLLNFNRFLLTLVIHYISINWLCLFQSLVSLFARLANDNIGYIDWDPYIPKVRYSLCWHRRETLLQKFLV